MARWREVEGWVSGFVERAYGIHAREATPIGFYASGSGLL